MLNVIGQTNNHPHSFLQNQAIAESGIVPEFLSRLFSFIANRNPTDIQTTILVSKEWNLWSIDAAKRREHAVIRNLVRVLLGYMSNSHASPILYDIYAADNRILHAQTLIHIKSAVQALRKQVRNALTSLSHRTLNLLCSESPRLVKSESVKQLFESAQVYHVFYSLYHVPENPLFGHDLIQRVSCQLANFNVDEAIACINKTHDYAEREKNYRKLFDKLLEKRTLTQDLIKVAYLAHTTSESVNLLTDKYLFLLEEKYSELAHALLNIANNLLANIEHGSSNCNIDYAMALINTTLDGTKREKNYRDLFNKLLKKRKLTPNLITIAYLAHTTIESAQLLSITCIHLQEEGHLNLALALVPAIVDREIIQKTYYTISMNVGNQGNPDRALELANQYLTTLEREEMLWFIHQAYQQKGDFDKAIETFNMIPASHKDEARVRICHVLICYDLIDSLILFIKRLPEDLQDLSFIKASLTLADDYLDTEQAMHVAWMISDEDKREETLQEISESVNKLNTNGGYEPNTT